MIKACRHHIVPTLILLTVAICLSLAAHFAPYSKESFGHDAAIFAYVGSAVTQGKILYTGAWDNKGPLLYLINALGIILNYRYGIWALEVLALFVALLFMYKTAHLFTSRWISVMCAVFCMLPLSVTLEGGNLSEEYALPFISACFYFITKFFAHNLRIKNYEVAVAGVCVGALFMLRLNLLAFPLCAIVGIVLTLVRRKEFSQLGSILLFGLVGFIVSTFPIFFYLAMNDALIPCLDAAYLGTLNAFSPMAKITRIHNVVDMICNFVQNGGLILVVFIFIFPLYVYRSRNNTPIFSLLWISFIGLLVNLLANSISGGGHMHYFMSFIPIMIIPTVWFAKGIENIVLRQKGDSFQAIAAIIVIALLLSGDPALLYKDNVFNNLINGTNEHESTQSSLCANYLTSHTAADDTVQVFGDVTLYYKANRLASSNYPCYAPGRFSDEAKIEFSQGIYEDMLREKPEMIMIVTEDSHSDFIQHLSSQEEARYLDWLNTYYNTEENDLGCIIYHRIPS